MTTHDCRGKEKNQDPNSQPLPIMGRMTACIPAQSPSPKFFFVNESSSSKGKRSHVMKQYIQSRRKEKNAALFDSTSLQLPRQQRYLAWRKKLDEEASGERLNGGDYAKPQTTSLSKKTEAGPIHAGGFTSGEYPRLENAARSLSSQRTISSSRVDPFDALPWSFNDEDRHLMDCWMSKLTSWSGQNHFMKKSLFREAMQHPMTFHACILTYSARYLATVRRIKNNTQCSSYISTTENLLTTYLRKGQCLGDSVSTMVFTALSIQEARYGSRQKSSHYLDQAVQNLRSLEGKRLAGDTYTHYARLTMFKRDLPFDIKHASHLLSFLRNAETLAFSHSTPPFTSTAPQRKAAFEYMTPLHSILSGGPHPSQVPEIERVWVLRYELSDLCRVSSLVYLNKALWDQRNSPEGCIRYLDNLTANIYEHLEPNFPVESFSWLLLQDVCDLDLRNPDRAWFVGDIMEGFKQIPQPLQFQFTELLLSFLMLKSADFNITLEGFERQILQFAQPEGRMPAME
ncbi:hypothetical protein I7I53_01004 [Histoplasma capsulatum var. duboisii H88]|uniref:Uncharacterized protein n=1 Tax=Ajellomyces capsulatus (strain H88) TaxID=544711 RepID=A0A8A1LP35_AJEC8|nr:hypothetical protein I7I53_01004 [Histoplasma capsulatum var. duboisii H88]